MAFIPAGARWYLAHVVLEIRVEGDSRNIVQVNTRLVEADTPEAAYEKALALGREEEREWTNVAGDQVKAVFRGLRDLNVIHDTLEHGAELMYTEDIAVPEEKILRWAKPRERLGVFAPMDETATDRT